MAANATLDILYDSTKPVLSSILAASSKMSAPANDGDITRLLTRLSTGDQEAEEALFALVYAELHRIASAQIRRERPGHTLQPTALLNEAYLRLCGHYHIDWQDRMHFYRIAAKLMRRILVDYAKQHNAKRRGGGQAAVTFSEEMAKVNDQYMLTVEIDQLLELLGQESPRLVQVVEMKFFAQLTDTEIASALNISDRTVKRDWLKARAWLHLHIAGNGNE